MFVEVWQMMCDCNSEVWQMMCDCDSDSAFLFFFCCLMVLSLTAILKSGR